MNLCWFFTIAYFFFMCSDISWKRICLMGFLSRDWSVTMVAWAVLWVLFKYKCNISTVGRDIRSSTKMTKSYLALASDRSSSILGHRPGVSMDLYKPSFLQQLVTHQLLVVSPLHWPQAWSPRRPCCVKKALSSSGLTAPTLSTSLLSDQMPCPVQLLTI